MSSSNCNNEDRCLSDLFGCLNSGIENKCFGAAVPHMLYSFGTDEFKIHYQLLMKV